MTDRCGGLQCHGCFVCMGTGLDPRTMLETDYEPPNDPIPDSMLTGHDPSTHRTWSCWKCLIINYRREVGITVPDKEPEA